MQQPEWSLIWGLLTSLHYALQLHYVVSAVSLTFADHSSVVVRQLIETITALITQLPCVTDVARARSTTTACPITLQQHKEHVPLPLRVPSPYSNTKRTFHYRCMSRHPTATQRARSTTTACPITLQQHKEHVPLPLRVPSPYSNTRHFSK